MVMLVVVVKESKPYTLQYHTLHHEDQQAIELLHSSSASSKYAMASAMLGLSNLAV